MTNQERGKKGRIRYDLYIITRSRSQLTKFLVIEDSNIQLLSHDFLSLKEKLYRVIYGTSYNVSISLDYLKLTLPWQQCSQKAKIWDLSLPKAI